MQTLVTVIFSGSERHGM